jgi:hypothetical protein
MLIAFFESCCLHMCLILWIIFSNTLDIDGDHRPLMCHLHLIVWVRTIMLCCISSRLGSYSWVFEDKTCSWLGTKGSMLLVRGHDGSYYWPETEHTLCDDTIYQCFLKWIFEGKHTLWWVDMCIISTWSWSMMY